ncbi:MAG: transcription termination/antitermination protein NusG [Candidatus Magasanikbacteria bacterium]
MAKQNLDQGRRWYVLHTYSGYEDKVKRNLERRIETFDMEDKVFNVMVPKENKIKIDQGEREQVEEKIFPGYVLVEMIVTDDSWYVVRNTPNVTGFVGSGTTPTPIDETEMQELQERVGIEEPEHDIDIEEGQPVEITDGPFKDFEGKVSEVDEERGKVKVLVNMFDRETPVELDVLQVEEI